MSAERDAFKAALESQQPPQGLRVQHKAIIVDQDGGTVGVKLTSPDAPSETVKPVPVYFGLPAFGAKFRDDAETMVGFVGGREDGAFGTSYPFYPQGVADTLPPLPVEYLSFGGGSLPIARKGDSVSCGTFRLSNLPPGPGGIPTGLIIEFRVSANGAWLALGSIVGPIAVVPSPLEMPISGQITSGREEFRA